MDPEAPETQPAPDDAPKTLREAAGTTWPEYVERLPDPPDPPSP